jgi:hypothetical protein
MYNNNQQFLSFEQTGLKKKSFKINSDQTYILYFFGHET